MVEVHRFARQPIRIEVVDAARRDINCTPRRCDTGPLKVVRAFDPTLDDDGILSVLSTQTALRWTFVLYAALGVVILVRYRTLSAAIEPSVEAPHSALGPSRRIVYRLAALFSLDAFGGGFVLTALIVLWLQRRFDLSIAVSGRDLLLGRLAVSLLVAPRREDRRPHRARAHDGLHPSAGERVPRPRRVHADRNARRWRPARPVSPVADGRAGADLIRDGRRLAGRASSGGERHQRAAKPRLRDPTGDRRLAPRTLGLRLAARHRRHDQGALRPARAATVPQHPTTRGRRIDTPRSDVTCHLVVRLWPPRASSWGDREPA